MLKYAEVGKLDMVASLYWTKERGKVYTYTEPYLMNEARVFVLKNKKFKLEKLEDLIGLMGGTPYGGGSYGDKFDLFTKKHLDLVKATSKQQHINLILNERVDYFILDYQDGMIYLKNNELENKIVPLDYPISTTKVHFAFSKLSPCINLLESINRFIVNSTTNGIIKNITHKYIK